MENASEAITTPQKASSANQHGCKSDRSCSRGGPVSGVTIDRIAAPGSLGWVDCQSAGDTRCRISRIREVMMGCSYSGWRNSRCMPRPT